MTKLSDWIREELGSMPYDDKTVWADGEGGASAGEQVEKALERGFRKAVELLRERIDEIKKHDDLSPLAVMMMGAYGVLLDFAGSDVKVEIIIPDNQKLNEG